MLRIVLPFTPSVFLIHVLFSCSVTFAPPMQRHVCLHIMLNDMFTCICVHLYNGCVSHRKHWIRERGSWKPVEMNLLG